MPKPPHNEHELELAIVRKVGNDNAQAVSVRTTMANAIVGQFLCDGAAVKGGSSLRFRYGSENSRYTMDFDVTRRIGLDEFLEHLKMKLAAGWVGFTGEISILPQAAPKGVPFDYVMQPIKVRLFYKGKNWCSVDLEVSLGEAGAAEHADNMSPNEETLNAFRELGFPDPGSVPLMPIEHQIAQKLSGLSGTASRRAHDLIDLQIIFQHEKVSLTQLKDICQRLFTSRRKEPWPPTIVLHEDWPSLYDAQRTGLPVLPTVDEAIEWVNALIKRIANA